MGFNENCDFRFRGITKIRDGEKIIIFALDEFQVITKKNKASRDNGPDELPDVEASTYACKKKFFSDDSTKNYLRIIRDNIISCITRDDICSKGTEIENPMIGRIPSKQEILQEINDLLLTMWKWRAAKWLNRK
jgi:hypothetical protein